MDNKKLMKKRQKRKDVKKRSKKSANNVNDISKYVDFSHPWITDIQPEDDFFDNNFFLKDSIKLDYVELSIFDCIFDDLFGNIYDRVMYSDKPLKAKDYRNIHIKQFNKTLSAESRAFDLANHDPNVIVGELADPRYISDEKFSMVISIPKAYVISLLEYITKENAKDPSNNTRISDEEYNNLRHIVANSGNHLNDELDQLNNAISILIPIFGQKIASFCNLEKFNQISEEDLERMKQDESKAIELRMF